MSASLTEATDPYCLRDGESRRLLRGHPWRRFVVLGDSVAEGCCEPVPGYRHVQWADRIAAELAAVRPELAYLNLGRRGLRAHEVRAEQLEPALAFGPDLALVVCGGNDAFRSSYDPDAVDAELTSMISALQEVDATVITVGMFDVSYSPAVPERLREHLGRRMRQLSERTGQLAAALGTVHVQLTVHPAAKDPSIYSSDGRHGNSRSDAIATAETVRSLGAWLRSPGARPDG